MGDTTVIKVDSSHSPKGPDGQVYLATGKHIAMRMWRDVAPGGDQAPVRRDYECAGYAISGRAELLGELLGKVGWFTTKASRAERDAAERCAEAVPSGLVRLQEATERAGQGYVAGVAAQRERDAVAVPGLSAQAWAAVRAVEREGDAAERAAAAGDNPLWMSLTAWQDPRVAEAWAREVESKPVVAAELRAVVEAARRRLGEDGAREAARGARSQGGVAITKNGPGQRAGVGGIGRVLGAVQDGQLARQAQEYAVERQRAAERERLGLSKGRGMRM